MTRPLPHRPDPQCDPDLWLVDGFNVLCAGVLRGREYLDPLAFLGRAPIVLLPLD